HLFEDRVDSEGVVRPAVLLDSVGSAANRAEEALLRGVQDGVIHLPDLLLDVEGYGEVSTLQLPHRCFDAYLREGLLDGEPFPTSAIGSSLQHATMRDATAIYRHCPVSLLFGAWNSHGIKGGMGAKFARVLSAEIVGLGVQKGERRAQKTDPLAQKTKEIAAYEADGRSFTLHRVKGSKAKQVKLSELGFGSVPAKQAGGVTVEYAEQHVVLSLGQLRRLCFPIDGEDDEERNLAGRAVLATLGILAIELQRDHGFSLRSGCELALEKEPAWELVGRTLENLTTLEVGGSSGALRLFKETVDHAASKGLTFAEPLQLTARDELVELVERARSV
ncbi:MAG: type I-U CRISPR-associated RAMP protein Csb1/Cas7u, partial [Thermoanaerobaculia bacterium]|nr:type I-U CRISPR-associated RAMP protein Csb1/Cas7u [Thermoanaerobaculia bacterium]